MPTILVATRDGMHRFDDEGRPQAVDHAGRSVTALGRARDEFWAIVDASELWDHSAGNRRGGSAEGGGHQENRGS
jgi:hypothetical protein